MFKNTDRLTWLQNKSAYSAGHSFTAIYNTWRCGSTDHVIT